MSRIFLAMNGKRINTLDDLRSNFNPDQMLSFYRSGRLQKWLEECGATEELENINCFEANYGDATLLSMLMAVFELDDNQIANAEVMNPTSKEEVPAKEEQSTEEKTTFSKKPAVTARGNVVSQAIVAAANEMTANLFPALEKKAEKAEKIEQLQKELQKETIIDLGNAIKLTTTGICGATGKILSNQLSEFFSEQKKKK